ncbi:MAG: hypothetical protein V3S93_00310, partial [Methyloceanibacter sp.]
RGNLGAPRKALEPANQTRAPSAEHELKDGKLIPSLTGRAAALAGRKHWASALSRRLQQRSSRQPVVLLRQQAFTVRRTKAWLW